MSEQTKTRLSIIFDLLQDCLPECEETFLSVPASGDSLEFTEMVQMFETYMLSID